MKHYFVSTGVMGLMPDGKYHLFATEQDYFEAYASEKEGEL